MLEENHNPKELIDRAKRGDDQAFGALYSLYYVPVFRYIYFRVKNKEEAEDIAQIVFVKAYGAIGRYVERGKDPLAYFFTIARTTIIDYWRKKKPLSLEELEYDPPASSTPYDNALQEEAKRLVTRYVEHLSDDQKDAIVMKFIHGLSNAEISQVLKKSEVAIRQLQSRGLRALRALVKEHESQS